MTPDIAGDEGTGDDVTTRSRAPTARRRRAGRRATGALAAVALAVAAGPLAGCADDGRELRRPRPDQTTTTAGPTTTTAPGSVSVGPAPAGLVVSSPAIGADGVISDRFTCRGVDVAPPLQWGEAPDGTAEIAVTMREAGTGVTHWVVSGLPPDTTALAEGTLPEGATVAVNSFGGARWDGPCPQEGTHFYDIRVYAFGNRLGIAPEARGDEAVALIESTRPLAAGVLSISAGAPAGAG